MRAISTSSGLLGIHDGWEPMLPCRTYELDDPNRKDAKKSVFIPKKEDRTAAPKQTTHLNNKVAARRKKNRAAKASKRKNR